MFFLKIFYNKRYIIKKQILYYFIFYWLFSVIILGFTNVNKEIFLKMLVKTNILNNFYE